MAVRWQVLALLVFSLAVLLPGQASIPPFDRDEARFAQATKQMVESGDYIDIRFQDAHRYKKPIGIYWLQAASVKLTGAVESIWAYRLPSVLGAVVAVLLTVLIGQLLFGATIGVLAGFLLASCMLLSVEARMAKTDAMLLATILAAQAILARAWLKLPVPAWQAYAFWAAVAAGILIKGPIILLVAGATALGLCLIERSGRWLLVLRPLSGFLLVVALVSPWLAAISVKSEGAFWTESVGKDLLAKAVGEQESHGGPPGYYLGSFFLTFWPWAGLLPLAAYYAWRQKRDRAVQFLVVWLLPTWVLFELLPTKLLHYTLPTFPAIALLIAAAVLATDLPQRLRAVSFGLVGLLCIVMAGGVVAITAKLQPLMAPALLVGALLTPLLIGLYRRALFMPALAVGLAIFYGQFFGRELAALDFWVSRSAAALIQPHQASCPGPVISLGYNEPSLVFLLGTGTYLAEPDGAGAAVNAALAHPCALVLVSEPQLMPFQAALPAGSAAVPLGKTSGFNYAKGDPVQLTLYRLGAPPP